MDAKVRQQLEIDIAAVGRDCPPPRPPAPAEQHRAKAARETEPFGRWLLAQVDRGDWIDELAAAARADRGFLKNGSPNDVRARLTTFGATGDAFEQVDDAERIWRSL